jgi:Mg-chelatase subunit ChlD
MSQDVYIKQRLEHERYQETDTVALIAIRAAANQAQLERERQIALIQNTLRELNACDTDPQFSGTLLAYKRGQINALEWVLREVFQITPLY